MLKHSARTLINYSKSVMSHSRDITVIHTIDKRIFFDIPSDVWRTGEGDASGNG